MRDEVHQVTMHFLEVRQIDIHHVAPLVLGEMDVTADFWIQLHVLNSVADAVLRAGKVA